MGENMHKLCIKLLELGIVSVNPTQTREPDMSTALGWWCELPAKWTPVGWKNHLFRYNVLYNGMISAVPNLNPRAKSCEGFGMQVGVYPIDKPDFPGHVSDPQDNSSVLQGWNDCPAPVLWSEWAMDGILFREEIFAHVPGAGNVETGIEPLFAWVRLSVYDVLPGLPLPERYGFGILINAPYISVGAMSIRYNVAVQKEISKYPRELKAECEKYDPASGLRIIEPDGRIRLAVAPNQECSVQVLPNTPTDRDFLLYAEIEVKKGSHVDLLLPMLPMERDVFDKELAIGYDRALDETNEYWSKTPAAATVFDVPEDHIKNSIIHNLKLSEIIAEKDPASGFYSILTGSWAYADLWSTPGCMLITMLLDTMGYHEAAERYLRMYIEDQGSVIPAGEYFKPHSGSFGPPKSIAACDWTSDHGAILWAMAEHALISGDQAFIETATEPIVNACEYIRDTRHISGHDGVPGLMPPGIATDMPTQIQSVWADAWNYKGLITAVRFLKKINHPRAEEFAQEAVDYKATFTDALRKAAETMPTWTDDEGNEHHLVPMAVYGAQPFEYRNAFYLDTGPLVLVFAGLLDADDDMMKSTLKWFREGPPTKIYRYDSDCWQVPSLAHEMSSCEPCFSWNVFHSWQSGDRDHFIEGMYSLFAGAISRQTYTVCETRGGVTGLAAATVMVYMARLAVIDDQISEDELHLMRLMPLAWLQPDGESKFENLPTEFGPVTLLTGLSSDGSELRVTYKPSFRTQPKRVVLHVPSVENLARIVLNGEMVDWNGENHLTLFL